MTWILFTFLAAFSQAWRNAFQSRLSKNVSVIGVTLSRFLCASPLAFAYLVSLYQIQPVALPTISKLSVFYICAAASMQIIATGLMVVLFKQKNFAIGAGLAKSEAIIAAILGMLFFGTTLTLLGWIGVFIGTIAVCLLSCPHGFRSLSPKTALFGIACGASFALCSLWIRESSLSLVLPFPHRAAWVLFLIISLQTIVLLSYLLVFDRATLKDMWAQKKLVLCASVASGIGSLGWFSAMSLQSVPYVKTLGQIEIFFTMLVSYYWLKEPVKRKDMLALVLVAIAAIFVMWE